MDSQVRRTYNVGLILGNVSYKFSDPFWSPILNAVDDELIQQEYHLRFAFTEDDLKRGRQRRLLSPAHIDGLILAGGPCPFDHAAAIGRFVIIEGGDIEGGDQDGPWQEQLPADVIAIEKRRAMYRIVEHLAALGHRCLGFIGPAPTVDERAESLLVVRASGGARMRLAVSLTQPGEKEVIPAQKRKLFVAQPLSRRSKASWLRRAYRQYGLSQEIDHMARKAELCPVAPAGCRLTRQPHCGTLRLHFDKNYRLVESAFAPTSIKGARKRSA